MQIPSSLWSIASMHALSHITRNAHPNHHTVQSPPHHPTHQGLHLTPLHDISDHPVCAHFLSALSLSASPTPPAPHHPLRCTHDRSKNLDQAHSSLCPATRSFMWSCIVWLQV